MVNYSINLSIFEETLQFGISKFLFALWNTTLKSNILPLNFSNFRYFTFCKKSFKAFWFVEIFDKKWGKPLLDRIGPARFFLSIKLHALFSKLFRTKKSAGKCDLQTFRADPSRSIIVFSLQNLIYMIL